MGHKDSSGHPAHRPSGSRTSVQQAADAAARAGADHRRRHQRGRHLPRPRPAGRGRGARRARRLLPGRQRRLLAHDPRRHPVPRKRRVPPRPGVRGRAQPAPADRAALRQAAADHHPDLQHLLRRPRRPAALPDPQAAGQAQGARGVPDQARPEHVRLLLPRRRHASRATSSAAASRRWPSCPACTPASSTRPPTSTPPSTTPSASPSTCSRTARRPARRTAARPAPATTSRSSPGGRPRTGRPAPGQHCPAARRADRRGLRLHRRRHRQHHRRLGRPDQPGHGRGVVVHGRHQGLAHRAGPPGAARGVQRPRDLLRAHRRPDRADLPDGGPRPGRHHRRRRRHGRGRRLHRGGDRLLLRPDRPRVPGHRRWAGTRSSTRFSGVRPLPKHDATQPGFVSRDYRIERRAGRRGGAVVSASSAASGPRSGPSPST